MSMPLVHIIILTWNHWEETAVCLQSLCQLTYPNYKIIIVDNASTDDTVQNIRQQYPQFTLIINKQNLGFAAGVNIGIRYALDEQTDYLFLLNNDTTVPPNLLDVMIHYAETLPNAGILTPMLHYLDDSEQLWFCGTDRNHLTLESKDFGHFGPRRHIQSDTPRTVDYIFGTAMLIPQHTIANVGLLDEHFFMYYEDMDFCIRVQAVENYKLYTIPDVSVGHGIETSTSTHSAMRYYHKARASIIFFRKHANLARAPIIIPFRFANAVRTTIYLVRHKEKETLQFYLRGLKEGLQESLT